MSKIGDSTALGGALASVGDGVSSLDTNDPQSVVGLASAVTGLATTIAGMLTDVGPFLGSLGIDAAIGSATSDGIELDRAIHLHDPAEIRSAALGLLGDAASLVGTVASFAAAAAIAEGGLNPAADVVAVAATGLAASLAIANAGADNWGYISGVLGQVGHTLDSILSDVGRTSATVPF